MNIISYKKQIARLQKQGKWNDALFSLIHHPQLFNDSAFDALCIAEMYWLLEEKEFMVLNPQNMPNGYEDIDWSFQNRFDELVSCSIEKYRNEIMFSWEIGCLIMIDSTPFFNQYRASEIEAIGATMLNHAVDLSNECEYHELILLSNGNLHVHDKFTDWKTRLFEQLSNLQLQDNLSDSNFQGHLSDLINSCVTSSKK